MLLPEVDDPHSPSCFSISGLVPSPLASPPAGTSPLTLFPFPGYSSDLQSLAVLSHPIPLFLVPTSRGTLCLEPHRLLWSGNPPIPVLQSHPQPCSRPLAEACSLLPHSLRTLQNLKVDPAFLPWTLSASCLASAHSFMLAHNT